MIDSWQTIINLLGGKLNLLGTPNNSLILSPKLEPGHVFVGVVEKLALMFDYSHGSPLVQIHSITLSKQTKGAKSSKLKTHHIVFNNPPASILGINCVQKKDLTFDEAAAVLGISLRHLFRLIAEGIFKTHKKGKRKLLASKDVLRWAKQSDVIGRRPYLIGDKT